MHHDHLSIFALLSIVVAIFCAWTALDLFDRVRAHGRAAGRAWLAMAALAMGGGVWSMHFIAMLGFNPGAPVSYALGLTALSFLLAVAGTGAAFTVATWTRTTATGLLAAGAVMGGAICTMHYVGMAAVRTAAILSYRPGLVALSALIAIVASTAALFTARRQRSALWRAGASTILGLAVVGMHYTGMAALRLTPMEHDATAMVGAPPVMLAVAVAGVTLFVLFLALSASMADQRGNLLSIIDAGGVGYWEMSLPSRRMWMSERGRRLLGVAPDAEYDHAAITRRLGPEDAERRKIAVERAIAGEGDYDIELPLGADGGWIHIRGRLIRSRSGRALKLAGVVTDVTDRRRAFAELETSERRQRLLINELNHRVKNTLATIQSIAALTARRASSVDAFVQQFQARLLALSNTHNLLTAHGWERAGLGAILEQEVRPYATGQVELNGPEILLEAEQALAVGLVIHELVTNAAKYGALSRRSGRLVVRWRESEEGRLTLEWEESGGPKVKTPTATGFGARLIRTSLEGMLGGEVETDYAPRGLRLRLRFDLRKPAKPVLGVD